MADQRIKYIVSMDVDGFKKGATEANKALSDMQKRMDHVANYSMQKFNAQQEEAAKKLREQEEAGRRWKTQLGQITIGLTAAAVAAKKFWDFAEEGAQIEFTALKFDRLAESIGSTGDAMREDLAEATDGLLSKSEQMALVTDIMALGLTKTADQSIRLARVVSQLDADMNQVTLALTNQTTARFDQIGIAVSGFDERLQGLIDSGMSAEDAFTEAFLQQGEAQIEKVGSISETTAGQMKQFEATVKDTTDAVKILASQELGKALSSNLGQEWLRIMNLVNNGDLTKWQGNLMMVKATFSDISDELSDLENPLNKYIGLIEDNVNAANNAYNAEYNVHEERKRGIGITQDASDSLVELADSFDDLNLSLDNVIENQLKQIEYMERGGLEAQNRYTQALADYKAGLIDTNQFQMELYDSLVDTMVAMGDFDGMTTDQIQQELMDAGVPFQKAAAYAWDIFAALNAIDGKTVNAKIVIHTQGGGAYYQPTDNPSGYGAGPGSQAGADFIVPPMFSGDNFPVRATAGERVQVTPKSDTMNDALVKRADERRRDERLARLIGEQILIGMS